MSSGNSRYSTHKFLSIGPGGRKCSCCFPAPRSKARKADFRSAKRKEKRIADADAIRQLIEDREWLIEIENEMMEDLYADEQQNFSDYFDELEREYERQMTFQDYYPYDDYGYDIY